MNSAKVTPTQLETSFPQQKENPDNNDANDSKLNLLESEGPQENIEPAFDQPEISDAQRVDKQAPSKFVSKSQSIRQHYEFHNRPITDSISAVVEKSESSIINTKVKRQEIELYHP